MRKGIKKGYLTFVIYNESIKGYYNLKNKLIDEKINVPLRYEKLKAIILGRDEKGEIIWNKGNIIRNYREDYKQILEKLKPELWEEIKNNKINYIYREKENRQGHSNKKKSYWAFGYDTLEQFVKNQKEEDVEEYKNVHKNCCGLGEIDKTLKYENK